MSRMQGLLGVVQKTWGRKDKPVNPLLSDKTPEQSNVIAMGEEEARRRARARSVSGSGTILGDAEKLGG